MPATVAIDELLEQILAETKSGKNAMEVLSFITGSYFANYDSLNVVESVAREISSLQDNVDERPYIDHCSKMLRSVGLMSAGLVSDDPEFVSKFRKYFHMPKQKVLEQLTTQLQNEMKSGTDIYVLLTMIEDVNERIGQAPQAARAAYDMLDYFVANACTQIGVSFLSEVGSVLSEKGQLGKPEYTTFEKAVKFYQRTISECALGRGFNGLFVAFASGCTKADRSSMLGGMGGDNSANNARIRLKSLLDTLKSGGYESFVGFEGNLEANFAWMKREFQGLSPTGKEIYSGGLSGVITPHIPQGIQNTVLGERCLKVATQYITG